ncbi:MAG: amidohydrolase family protein, partial [Alphaproteobacteria bacterium]
MKTAPDMVITGGRIVTPSGVVEGDLAIAGGTILSVGDPVDLASAKNVIDAQEQLVLPGGVDVHCHIEQMSGMGQWNADTFETATQSAAFGGTTSLISFAAQAAGERLSDTVENYAARARRGAKVDHAFHITVTDTSVPDFEAELGALIDAGHRSIKVFTTYNIQLSDAQILAVLSQAKAHGALVCVHAENDAIIARAKADLLAKGQTHPRNHALSRPRIAEIEAVERMCRFAEHLDQPVMLFHISTREAVDVIRTAKARGVPVWAETCPHYLLMTD